MQKAATQPGGHVRHILHLLSFHLGVTHFAFLLSVVPTRGNIRCCLHAARLQMDL
jgi:hypothetical protein